MIKLNRTTEYGLMALQHMSRKRSVASSDLIEFTSAREVADMYGLPFEITAKTLQRMKESGLIQSAQGARGGYILERSLEDITLADFLHLMEGPQAVVACTGSLPPSACEYESKCEMKGFLGDLNNRFIQFLQGIRLAELTKEKS